MRQLKIISIFLILLIVIALFAYGYDTARQIQSLTAQEEQFSQQIVKLEKQYLTYLPGLNLEDPAIEVAISNYQGLTPSKEQEAIFEELTILVLAQIVTLDATNQGVRGIVDQLEGVKNRRALLLPMNEKVGEQLTSVQKSFGANLAKVFSFK